MMSSALLKYARALADVALELDQEDQVQKELQTFVQLLDAHEELKDTLRNPVIPFSSKRNIVEEVAKTVPVTKLVVNFVLVLLEHARIHQFQEAVETYVSVLDEQGGIVRGQVLSASEVDRKTKDRLRKVVSAATGREVKMEYHVDESLLGGLRLQIGSTIYDGSLGTQLEEIRRRFARG